MKKLLFLWTLALLAPTSVWASSGPKERAGRHEPPRRQSTLARRRAKGQWWRLSPRAATRSRQPANRSTASWCRSLRGASLDQGTADRRKAEQMTGKMNRQSVPVGSSKERRNIMKPQIIIGALLAITIGSASAAWADRDCDCRPGGPEWQEGHRPAVRGPGQGNREHEERDFARIGKALILTEAQKAKIEGIVQAERDKSAPLRQKLEDTWKKLRQAEQAAKFDEAAVRTIAASHAQWLTEMMVARARAQNQIHALLTTEQCAIADKLRPPIDDGGPGHFRLPRHESGPGHSRPPRQKSDYGDMPHCGCE